MIYIFKLINIFVVVVFYIFVDVIVKGFVFIFGFIIFIDVFIFVIFMYLVMQLFVRICFFGGGYKFLGLDLEVLGVVYCSWLQYCEVVIIFVGCGVWNVCFCGEVDCRQIIVECKWVEVFVGERQNNVGSEGDV